MNYKAQGEITELRFFLRAFESGCVVSKPFGDSQPYDFIIDGGGKLFRVQVKSTFAKDKTPTRSDRYRINASRGASRKKCYTKHEIDILVVYIVPEDVWYIIPVDEIKNIKTLGFRPHRDSKGRLEKYREAWVLFK